MAASKHSVLLRPPLLAGALMAGGCLAVAVVTNLGFVLTVEEAVNTSGGSWGDVFPLDDPEFSESFWHGVRSYLSPLRLFYFLGSTYTWLFLVISALLGWYWYVVLRNNERSLVFLLPAVTPFLVGLAIMPMAMLVNFDALARVGLSNPSAIGSGVGESTVGIYAGVLFSLISLLVMLVTRARRSPPAETD
ncbi:MAG: hypothetical protein GY719_40930 [bacterium]|nr:hypothetical protein [bacterium]